MNWLYSKKLERIESIHDVESFFNVKFPADFISIVKEYNAGMPNPNVIDTNRAKGKAFGELLNFNLDSNENIISIYEDVQDKLPNDVIPITIDPAGNHLCLDYRKDIEAPLVVRWDHEQKFIIKDGELIIPDHEIEVDYYYVDFVANNFSEALDNLYGELLEQTTSWDQFQDETELRKKFSGEDLVQVNRIRKLQGIPPIEE